MLTLNDGRSELWQWDTGRKLTVDADCTQVHFSNKFFGRSVDVDVVDGVAEIPDVLLQVDKDLLVWAFVGTAENGYTKISKVFKVNKRNKPADYVFTPTEQTTLDEIMKRLDRIEEGQDPDAIKNAVDEYIANNPIQVEEKDPTVPEWAKQPIKPKYTAKEVGAVATVNGKTPDENGNVEITIPDSGGNVDLTGYAKEQWVQQNYQPKGEYLTAVPDGYAKTEDIPTKPEDIGAQPSGNYALKTEIPSIPVQSVNGKTGAVKLSASDVGARPDNWMPSAQEVGALPNTYTPPNQTAAQVGADPKGTAASAVSQHNVDDDSHNDIRLELKAINDRLTAFFDSDNQTLDELSEIVAYITSNKALIDSITTSKVSVADIINNLTTNVSNKPLSAAQGVALKALIDAITIPTKLSQLTNDKGYITGYTETDPTVPTWAKQANKPSYSKSEVGLGNVDNVKQYSASNPPPYPVTSVNGKTGAIYVPEESVLYVAQDLTEAQKAQVRANIGASAGEDVEYADSVEWLNENGDTSKRYVLPDGFIYAWMGQTITTAHNANDGTCSLNKRTTKNVAMSTADSAQNGNLITPPIEIDNSWSECVLTISGISTLYPIYYAPLYIYYYAADGSYVMQMPAKQLGLTDNNEANLAIPADGLSVDLALPSYNGTTVWANTKYIRIVLGLSSGSALSTTSEAVKNLVINLEPLNHVATKYGWYSTGKQHSNDKATQQNSADIAALKERTDTLETGIGTLETTVEELRDTVESGGLTAVQTGEVFYAVGDSITYGSGGTNYGTINGSWVKHVIARNGYDTTKSKNLGVSGIGFNTKAPGQTIILRDVIAANDFSQADVVTVAAGINDWKNLNVMLEDFFTEFKYCLTQIRTANPYCRIFYILPFNMRFKSVASCTFANYYGLGYAGDSNELRCYGNTLKTFRNMIKEKFETDDDLKALNIHVIDITPINRNNIDSVTVDGLHPNDECYKRIGEMLAKIMDAT